jgi:multiple sugar transport system substrate-binding protein
MPQLELSVMNHSPEAETVLRSLLDLFESQTGISVQLNILEWTSAKAELNRIARYHQGPDVSEVGTTWVGDLISMNALRSLKPGEVAKIGRPDDFVPASWQTSHLIGDDLAWAVPWLSETYLIYYRKDLLAKAGIEESSAFLSHTRLVETAERLQKSGVAVPVEMSFEWDQFGSLHALASWVWAAGGDFCSPDGRQVLFDQPEALRAIHDYFGLLRFLSPEGIRATLDKHVDLYRQGLSAVMFSTLTFFGDLSGFAPGVYENTGAAVMPGNRFVGGSNLVVWKHTRQEEAAILLVQYLTSIQTLLQCIRPLRALPSRVSALAVPAITQDPILKVAADSVQNGRSYPQVPLWGLIEERLIRTLQQIALYYLSNPTVDLEQLVNHQIETLARRLNLTLSQ